MAISAVRADDTPSTFPAQAQGDFYVINESNPPKRGIWMSFDGAKQFAHDLDVERNEWKKLYFREQRNFYLESSRKEQSETNVYPDFDGNVKFWDKWGFPIGIGVGIVLSVAIGAAVIETTKR